MTHYEWICHLINSRHNTYPVPKLPEPNPDDFYIIRGDKDLQDALANMQGMNERENPACQFERLPDEGLL